MLRRMGVLRLLKPSDPRLRDDLVSLVPPTPFLLQILMAFCHMIFALENHNEDREETVKEEGNPKEVRGEEEEVILNS